MKRKYAIILALIITIVAAMWYGLFAWRRYSTLRKLSQVRSDLQVFGVGVMVIPVDWSLPLVPDAVFDPDSVYFRRYADRLGLDAEVMRLLNELPIDKRRAFLCYAMMAKKQFTNSELAIIAKICKKLDFDMSELSEECFSGWMGKTGGMRIYDSLERTRLYNFAALTSPIPYYDTAPHYVSIKPQDPFTSKGQGLYRFGTIIGTGRQHHNWHDWILLSNGPDMDIDLEPEYVQRDVTGQLVVYEDYPFTGRPVPICDFLYDPTNGIMSNGDVVAWPDGKGGIMVIPGKTPKAGIAERGDTNPIVYFSKTETLK